MWRKTTVSVINNPSIDIVLLCNYNKTMANLTIRNIPDEVLEKIRHLAHREKRSVNSELLMIIERGTEEELIEAAGSRKGITPSRQVRLWKNLSARWEDDRSIEEVIDDVYRTRTLGREVDL